MCGVCLVCVVCVCVCVNGCRERNALGHVPPPYRVPVRNTGNKVD